MKTQRKVEIFSAGCSVCQETIDMVKSAACPSCEIQVLNINEPAVSKRAQDLGIRSVPVVVVDGKLAECCFGKGPNLEALRRAGLGQPIAK